MTHGTFHALQKRVQQLQKEADQADGAVAQAMADLKAKYGVKTIKEAEELADKTDKEANRIANECSELEETFRSTYGHLLNNEDD